jgi:hypothetical protein
VFRPRCGTSKQETAVIIRRDKNGVVHFAQKVSESGHIELLTSERRQAVDVNEKTWAKVRGYYEKRANVGTLALVDGRRVMDSFEGSGPPPKLPYCPPVASV